MSDLIQHQGDTAERLALANPIIKERQLCVEKDTGRAKVGNGYTHYNALPYIGAHESTDYFVLPANEFISTYSGTGAPSSGTKTYGTITGTSVIGIKLMRGYDSFYNNVFSCPPDWYGFNAYMMVAKSAPQDGTVKLYSTSGSDPGNQFNDNDVLPPLSVGIYTDWLVPVGNGLAQQRTVNEWPVATSQILETPLPTMINIQVGRTCSVESPVYGADPIFTGVVIRRINHP